MRLVSRVLLPLIALLLVAAPAAATILTFNIKKTSAGNPTLWTNGTVVINSGVSDKPYSPYITYGNHVTGPTQNVADAQHTTYNYLVGNGYTPNIGVTETNVVQGAKLYWDATWPYMVIYQSAGAGASIRFTFAPDANYAVRVNSFALRSYTGTTTSSWTLYQDSAGGTVLASSLSTGQGQAGGTASSITMSGNNAIINANTNAGFYTGTLVLQVNTGGPNWGFNNINFDQMVVPVPEPASLALLAVGSLLVIRRKKD